MKGKSQTKTELEAIDLLPFLGYLNEYHEGNLLSLSNWIDRAIYMFHYLPVDTFTEFERQNISHVLMGLKEAVMEIYLNRCLETLK
ncbi:hypothetical protein [uncultured Maribacter sp.]|uniref:hypothetical protein n=1 Tax=uncultured Maribacter sp. TaxID=431308 RepID=UPI002618ABF1|nr:hypothetical protein [uncultured Maribacter sp.]